jgi:alkanesulfonate monooxygenase SsuD/methylene tetrahydromethanopterin reductase-like flavin-dependent oxidoreductase (luciferase family)
VEFWLRYDLRSPEFGAPTSVLAATAIEQAEWADSRGFSAVQLAEHHGAADGYNPSPLLLGAAIASRTTNVRIAPIVLLPLHDPVRLAEDVCVLDQISRGRVELETVLGYVPAEFAMFGVSVHERGPRADRALQVLRDAFDGRPFDYDGRHGTVSPSPYSDGGPPIFVGGSVNASARRAARLGDGYYPMTGAEGTIAEYERACSEFGRPVGRVITAPPGLFIHVSEDPERDWERVGPHLMYESNAYTQLARELGQEVPYSEVADVAELRKRGSYLVLTPEECVAYLTSHRDKYHMVFAALTGGMDPALSWESLELLADRVIPAMQAQDAASTNP